MQTQNLKTNFNVKKIESNIKFDINEDVKVFYDDQGRLIDVQNITIEGYASTFVGTTKADRIGDYILDGAFDETMATYDKNPIVLIDHENSTKSAAAKSLQIYPDSNGLKVKALLSNAPGMADTRIKVYERILRTFSIGGFFHYIEDGKGIHKVDLFEYSIVAIPMNPDATFTVRDLDFDDVKMLLQRTKSRTELENIARSIMDGRVVDSKALDNVKSLLNIKENSIVIDGLEIEL